MKIDNEELDFVLKQALELAYSTIHEIYKDHEDREELSEESVDKLKDSVHIIKLIKEMCTP